MILAYPVLLGVALWHEPAEDYDDLWDLMGLTVIKAFVWPYAGVVAVVWGGILLVRWVRGEPDA